MQIHPEMIFDRNNWSLAVTRLYKFINNFPVNRGDINNNKVLIILGCQRSGTSLIYWIFERDFNTKIYREKSLLNNRDHEGLRLNPTYQILKEFSKYDKKLIVIKPLVESQNANLLLHRIPNSKIIWMYRNYNDVVLSNIKAFGINNGINDIKPIVNNNRKNWRCQRVSKETQSIINKYFSTTMNPFDAAALFWFVRNRFFFEQRLDQNKNVMLCRYEDLVYQPEPVVKNIYDFIGYHYPGKRITNGIHTKSVGKGCKVNLSPKISQLCDEILRKLEDNYRHTVRHNL